MKFAIESIEVSLSRVYADQVRISHDETIDGRKHRNAVAVIKMESSGNVEDVTEEDLLEAINDKLGRMIDLKIRSNTP